MYNAAHTHDEYGLKGELMTGMAASFAQSRRVARGDSVRIDPVDLVEALASKLGVKLVAFIADRDASTISRWRKGQVVDETTLLPLRVAYQVVKMLETVEADATIRAWFIGSNPQLDDLSPAEALHDGLNRETLAATQAFLAVA